MSSVDLRTTAYPPSSALLWPVSVFFLASIVAILDRQILYLLVDPVRQHLQISDVEISLLEGAAFAVCYSTLALPMGFLADRVSRKALAAAGVLVWSLATIWGGLSGSFAEMFVSRMFVGLGEAALAPAAISFISDMAPPERRGRPLGVFLMGNGVGKGATIFIVGMIIAASTAPQFAHVGWLHAVEPWRLSFLACGAIGLLVVGLLLTIREPERRAENMHVARGDSLRAAWSYLIGNRRLLAPFVLALAVLSIGNYGLAAWGPSLLIRQFGMTPQAVGGTLGLALMIAGPLGSATGGIIADRSLLRGGVAARLRMNAISCLGLVPGALAVFAPNAWMAIGLIAFSTFSFATFGCLHATSAQDLVPGSMRGAMVGLQVLCTTCIGFVSGPLVIAVMTEFLFRDPQLVGYSMALTIVPAVALAFWTTVVSLRELSRGQHPDAGLAGGFTAAAPGAAGPGGTGGHPRALGS